MTKAQDYFNQNFTDKSIKQISFQNTGNKLTEDLIVQDYPDLEEISLKENELTSLTVANCPNLKLVNVRNNQLTKLELNDNNNAVEEIIISSNVLQNLDLTNCSNLKKLIIADNPDLGNIKGLSFSTIKHFNFVNTLFSLKENYQELEAEITEIKKEKEGLEQALKTYDEAGFQKKLVLTEPIQTPKQAEEAIKRLLVSVEKSWRTYFESTDPNIIENSPVLGAYFQFPEQKRKAKQILTWIIEAQTHGDYELLARQWNDGEKYNPNYDYDDSLYELMQLLGRKKELANK